MDFDYSLKVSARARRVRIAIKPYHGLEVVIPRRFPRKQVARILQQHAAWITIQLEKHGHTLVNQPPPQSLHFALTDEQFSIAYRDAQTPALTEHGERLTVNHADTLQAIAQLRRWIRQRARKVLPPRLQALAQQTGLEFTRCSVRSQKSRWGSCSSNGTISLNEQLLFLSPPSVDYLMLHELCHTRHMNHSPAFWRLVASFEPEYRQFEQTLNQGRTQVPGWYLQSLYRDSFRI